MEIKTPSTTDRIDFSKYLLPNTLTSNSFSLTSHQSFKSDKDQHLDLPSITFRQGKVCPGLGKAEDDKLANTSPAYLRLELAQVASELLDEF